MTAPTLPTEIAEFLALPNPAVMATLRRDGSPVTVATWYLLDSWDETPQILVNLDAGRARLAHLRRDPRVSLTALAESWYTHVSIQGRVTRIADDEGLADIDRISTHYGGQPYAIRDRPRFSVWFSIDSWHGWGQYRQS